MLNRVNLSFPEKPADFNCVLPVRVSDINYGGHLGNDRLVYLSSRGESIVLKGIGLY